jgi:hypothetical protein
MAWPGPSCRRVFALAFAVVACETRVDLVITHGRCNASNCTGCCDARDVCQAGSELACGKGGEACVACGTGTVCVNGACIVGGGCGTCSGCCSDVFCLPGNDVLNCGKNGQQCQQCPSTAPCIDGVCTPCTPSNCAGCCNYIGECLAGTSDDFNCGSGAASCRLCGGFTHCTGGACQ